MEPVIRLLCDLIAIPSVNPCFADGTGEAAIADFLETHARKAGLEVQRQPVADGRDNVLIGIVGQGNETVLLEAHMDTVTAEGMTIPPFDPQVKDNRVFGRGACDTKASLAAMLQALIEVARKGTPPRTVWLAATVDEENAVLGVQKLVADGFRADYAVVGEPTELRIVHAHKGIVRGYIVANGVSAHSSHPERGVNAIGIMAKVILALERYDAELRMRHHPLVGSPTLTVATIQGGRGLNLVPDRCAIGIDRRTLPQEDPLTAWDELRQFLLSQPELQGLPIEIPPPLLMHWGMELPADSLPVLRLKEAGERAYCPLTLGGVRYTTDASELVRANIPACVFGPGSIEQAHAAEEWVAIEQVLLAQKVLEHLIGDE